MQVPDGKDHKVEGPHGNDNRNRIPADGVIVIPLASAFIRQIPDYTYLSLRPNHAVGSHSIGGEGPGGRYLFDERDSPKRVSSGRERLKHMLASYYKAG